MKIVEENRIGFVVAVELEDIFNLIEMEIMYNFNSLSLMAAAERSPSQHWLKLKLARTGQLLCFAMINMLWPAREGDI